MFGKTVCYSDREIQPNCWTFICVNIGNTKGALVNKPKVFICINEHYDRIDFDEKNTKFEGSTLSHVIIGNNKEKKKGFQGKMSSVFICYKSFKESECATIYKYSKQNNLFMSLSNLKNDENKIVKDLRKTLIFEWQPNLKHPY